MEIYIRDKCYEVTLPVENRFGLHARPATEMQETINSEYDNDVRVANLSRANKEGEVTYVNGKSVMELMTLQAFQGSELSIHFSHNGFKPEEKARVEGIVKKLKIVLSGELD